MSVDEAIQPRLWFKSLVYYRETNHPKPNRTTTNLLRDTIKWHYMIIHSLFACWWHREVQSDEKIYEPKEKGRGQLMQCSKDTPSWEFILYSETLVLHISISWLAKKDQSFFYSILRMTEYYSKHAIRINVISFNKRW